MRSSILLLAALASAAYARPDTAKIKEEFRQRNPQHWTKIELDAQGRLKHLQTDDAAVVGHAPWSDDDVFELRSLLLINRDGIGARADEREPLLARNMMAFMLFDDQDVVVGYAVLTRRAGPKRTVLDIDIRFAKLFEAKLPETLIGRRFRQHVSFGHRRDIECGACRAKVVRTTRKDIVLDRDDIDTRTWLRAERNTVRLVICANARRAAEPEGVLDIVANRLVGTPAVPFVVDAMTRQTLPIRPRDCIDGAIENTTP